MIKPRQALRLWRVNWVLVRHGLGEIVLATHLFRPVRYLVYLSIPSTGSAASPSRRGERIRLSLEELGPVFVKFGQVLSTRRDLLPLDIADELAKLQDRVPPFPGAQARAMVESLVRRAGDCSCSRPSTRRRWLPPPSPRYMPPNSRMAARWW